MAWLNELWSWFIHLNVGEQAGVVGTLFAGLAFLWSLYTHFSKRTPLPASTNLSASDSSITAKTSGEPTATKDVFISYAHADQPWVRVLAENLYQSGLEVFYDEWEMGPGDVLVHKIDAGILTAYNGVLVVSPNALERPWVQQEYAAMMNRAVEGKQRIIPVLLKEAEMPPLLAAHLYVDFRQADGPVYESRVRELIAALRGERPAPPPRELKPIPKTGFRAEGPLYQSLRIAQNEVMLSNGGEEASGTPRGLDARLEQLLWGNRSDPRVDRSNHPAAGSSGTCSPRRRRSITSAR